MDEKRMVSITPSEPRYFAFVFPQNVRTILLEVDSNQTTCMIISIQNISVSKHISDKFNFDFFHNLNRTYDSASRPFLIRCDFTTKPP